MNIHPLIHLAHAMPLDGYAVGTAHDALMREADRIFNATKTTRSQMECVSAMQLAEYILWQRTEGASSSLWPLPPATKAPITVRAKGGA